jgi:hypothetical protein
VLNSQRRIVTSADVVAEDLGDAVRHALDMLNREQADDPGGDAANIEIWQGDVKVFPPQR